MDKPSCYPNICLESLRTLRKTCVLTGVRIEDVLRASLRGKCYVNQPSKSLLTSGKDTKQISYIVIQGKDAEPPTEKQFKYALNFPSTKVHFLFQSHCCYQAQKTFLDTMQLRSFLFPAFFSNIFLHFRGFAFDFIGHFLLRVSCTEQRFYSSVMPLRFEA